jgi:protein-L-isoaspartate(D-aspartate) O-methyltransferase
VKSLAHLANLTLFKQGYDNVTLIYGDGFDGFISKSPYERIICAFALQEKPQNLLNQLKPGGFMVAPFEGRLTRFSDTGIEPLKIICAIPKGREGVAANL